MFQLYVIISNLSFKGRARMKIFKWVSLSLYNSMNRQKFFAQMVSSITLIMLVLSLVIIFNVVIINFYNNLVYGRAYNNSITFTAAMDEAGYFTDENEAFIKQLEKTPFVQTPIINKRINRLFDFDNIILKVDDNEYIWDSNLNSNELLFNRSLGFTLSKGSNAVFSENDYRLFSYNYKNQQLFLAGSDIANVNEVLLTDFILTQFGVKDYHDIIGKSVAFIVDGDSFFEDLLVSGVINNNYYRMRYFMIDSQIIISTSLYEFSSYDTKYVTVYAPIDSFENSQKVFNILKDSGYGNIVEFNEADALEYSYIVKIQSIIRYVFGFIGVFIITALLLNLYSILSIHMKNNLNYYGMMHAMGINRFELHLVFSLELLIIILSSAFISAGASALFIRVINYFAHSFFSGEVSIGISQYFYAIALVSVSIGFFIIIMSGIMLFIIQNRSISDMLRDI